MKHFWKSKINKRLVKSAGKLAVFVFLLSFILNIGKIQGTNSFFMDTANVTGNTMTAGYWVPPTISFIGGPVDGEEWQVGSSKNITWNATSADPAATAGMEIDLDYSCDSGANWHSIANNITNSGTKSWTVPSDVSDHCKIKIGTTDSHGLTNSVESNEFEISWMVVLNEFMPKPATGLNEWVEIYNKGSVPVDVNGWKIKDELNQSRVINSSHTNTGSTIINPGTSRFLVIQDYDSFYLNDDGDTIKLYDASDKLLDSHDYAAGDVAIGKTIARSPDGVGAWVDPVPTPGEKNDPSNDIKDFQKYYREVCFDKNNKPRCDLKFLKSLGLLDSKYQVVEPEPVVADIAPVEPAAIGTAPASPADALAPIVAPVTDPVIANDNIPSPDQPASGDVNLPVEEPKIISKEFRITLKGKLDVPDGFLAETDQKMKKIELSGEEKVINDLKDFEIDLSKIKIDKAGKIEILVSDLDLPKDVDLVTAKKDDTVVLITASEKPKEEPKKDEITKDDAALPKADSPKTDEKKDDSKDSSGGSGSGGDGSAPKGIDSATP